VKSLTRFTLAEIDTLPVVCGKDEICRIFAISSSRFHELVAEGALDMFMLKPAIGPKRFSGVLLRRYLQGDPLYQPTFGQRRSR
jgi:hypothetical protein